MTDEGVIKFQLDHTPAEPLPWEALAKLERWRGWMYAHGLIGVIETEHGPIGYGNISVRHGQGFIISGSQTGHLPRLDASHYTLVTAADPAHNRLHARGPIKPSSESLTHAMVYDQDPQIGWVLHAHWRLVWLAAARLGIPLTAPEVAYGTPEMAGETARLFAETKVKEIGIFAMAGHEDGIVSFGETAEQAAGVMEQYLRLAG
jgi:ribulose-5-phosphate 4-epimerase/fuculose-1-phosphate aldolase